MSSTLSSPNSPAGSDRDVAKPFGHSTHILKPSSAASLAAFCAVVGLFAVYSTAQALTGIWNSDALKSVGMAVPFVCFALILRDWRSLGWETEGTWWGFVLLAVTALVVFIRDQTLLIITVNKDWLLQLPPLPLIAVIYAASLVLLFGGKRLLRAAWFPVVLMWAVIPVPQTFSRRVDVPLQHAGAVVARAFAHLIGVRLNSTDLKIMFSPTTGMFIAPGCDGLRGSITMGLTAIAIAYYYRFRWTIFLPVVVAGVLLGYVFNFLRLCSMVIYDRFTVSYPRLGPHEQLADHIVGGCIFLLALAIFFWAIEKLKRPAPPVDATPAAGVRACPIFAKATAVLVLAAVFGADYVHRSFAEQAVANSTNFPPMPATLGSYKLVRTWLDQAPGGEVVYTWGEYAGPAAGSAHISVGVSPYLSVHDAEVCHIAKGEDPTWHGQMAAECLGGPVQLTAVTYNNGLTQKLEASTVCDNGVCQQYSQTGQHLTIVYARPHRNVPLKADQTRPVPVILKLETPDTQAPVLAAEQQLQAELEAFLRQTDLVKLTEPFGRK